MSRLLVVETHPVQYHAPVYRALAQGFGVDVHALYGSDFSVAGYRDPEFQAEFAWDTDLLSGYESAFLSRVSEGGARDAGRVSARGMGAAIARVRPDVVLVLGYSPGFHRSAFWHAWTGGYPVLFRGEATDAPGRLPFRFVKGAFLRWMYRRCSRVLYIGQRARAHFSRFGVPEQRLVFSPYAVDTSPFRCEESERQRLRAAARAEWRVDERELVLLFSGKLVHRKRPDLLVRAVKLLPPQLMGRVTVVFLGSGLLEPQLRGLAAETPEVKVLVSGFRNQRLLSPYYHGADLLVLPSEVEPWGLVVNEALQHGVPCVVSDRVGCAPDLIRPGHTGEIFAAGSERALAAALERAIAVVGDARVRSGCRELVGLYSVQNAAQGLAQAVREAAGGRPGG